jgi:hypothetical protein
MAYCGEHCCSATIEGVKTAVTLRCRAWTCPDCAPERKTQLWMKLKSGKPDRFLTLTSRVVDSITAEQAAKDLVRAWRLIRRSLKHANPNLKLNFMAVFEATKAGWPHLHILIRGPYLVQFWLSKQMERLTDSPHVDIRKVHNGSGAASYVSKYIGKAPGKFGTLKRYWCTPAWELDSKIKGRVKQQWSMQRMTLAKWCDMWRSNGGEIKMRSIYKAEARPPPGGWFAQLAVQSC